MSSISSAKRAKDPGIVSQDTYCQRKYQSKICINMYHCFIYGLCFALRGHSDLRKASCFVITMEPIGFVLTMQVGDFVMRVYLINAYVMISLAVDRTLGIRVPIE